MKVQSIEEREQADVQMEGASGTRMRTLIGLEDGAKNFHMRQFLNNGDGPCTFICLIPVP